MPQPSDFLDFWGIIGIGWLSAYGTLCYVVARGVYDSEARRAEAQYLLVVVGLISVMTLALLLLGPLVRL